MDDRPLSPEEISRRVRSGEMTRGEARKLLLAGNPPKAWERAVDPRRDSRGR